MQIESNTKRITFFFIAECSLSYQKIMQIESYTKRITFFFIAECSFILSKDNANRGQYKKNHILFYCRVQLILLQIEEDFYLL